MARSDTGCIRITPFGSFVKVCRKALLELRRQRRPIARKTRKSLISLLSLRSLQPELRGRLARVCCGTIFGKPDLLPDATICI